VREGSDAVIDVSVGGSNSLYYLSRIPNNLGLILSIFLSSSSNVQKLNWVLLSHVSGKDGIKGHLS
jgi:hypothetical protein